MTKNAVGDGPPTATGPSRSPLRVLVSFGWLGGAGGAERALHSILRALAHDNVDVVVRRQLDGPLSTTPPSTTVYPMASWRWWGAALDVGWKGRLVRGIINPVRRRLQPAYDVYLQSLTGPTLAPTVRAKVKLIIPSGFPIPEAKMAHFDYVAMQAPDNVRMAPAGAATVLLPPPLYELADHSQPPPVELPDGYYLTAFNPYDPVKGVEDLSRALRDTPKPIVWCHSQRTLSFTIPDELARHPRLIHVDDPIPAQLRYLYENCLAYLSFSKTEGFGWSLADGLRYSTAVVTREIGVFSYPQAWQEGTIRVSEPWSVDWGSLPSARRTVARDLTFLSPEHFRARLVALSRGEFNGT